jgi:hypothetical protein
MIKTRAALSLLLMGLAIAACSSGGPGTTITPIVTPSIVIPSFSVPPQLNPTPVDGLSPACQLVTEAEMTSLIGEPMTGSSSVGTECSWSAETITPTVIFRYDTGESIQNAKIAFPGGRDVTIGGNPAYFVDLGVLYIEKGGRTLVVQAIWSLDGDAELMKISQIGELAVSRF